MTLDAARRRSRVGGAWPLAPFVAFALLVAVHQFRGEDHIASLWALLLIVTSVAAGVSVMTLNSDVSKIAASSVLSAVAVIGYGLLFGLDAFTALSLFLAVDAVLILSCFVYARAAEQSRRTSELAAMLLFEGEVASRESRDQRQLLCRAMLSLSQRNERPFSVLRVEWPTASRIENEALSSREGEAARIHEHMVRFHASTAIEQLVRGCDVVLPSPKRNCVYLACPETDADGIAALSRRIAAKIEQITGAELAFASASYPADGYLIEELFEVADRGSRRWTARSLGAPAQRRALSEGVKQDQEPALAAKSRPILVGLESKREKQGEHATGN